MEPSVSRILRDKYNIAIPPGGKGECPFCHHKKTFKVKPDDTLGKCFHNTCGRFITLGGGKPELQGFYSALEDIFADFHAELLRQKSDPDDTAYSYLVTARKVHSRVVRDSMIGAVPRGYDVDAKFASPIWMARKAVQAEKKEKKGRPKKTPSPAEEHLQSLRGNLKKLRYAVKTRYGWVAFFYTDAHHRITAIRFREPYSKEIRLFKPFPALGVFGHMPFSQNAGIEGGATDSQFIVTEGEFNLLQVQSAKLRYCKATETDFSYLHGCAVGSATTPDFQTIRAISRTPAICFDNDDAGRKMVEKAQLVMGFEAFTTPKPDSDLDEFLTSFGKKKHKAAWKAFEELLASRTFHARDFKGVAEDIRNIRRKKGMFAFDKNQAVADAIVNDLQDRGKFYHDDQFAYFFSTGDKVLIQIDPEYTHYKLLLRKYGINASEYLYKYITENMLGVGLGQGTKTTGHRFAYFDKRRHILYWFNNDNQIYLITQKSIDLVDNGTDGVMFLKDGKAESFTIGPTQPKSDLLYKHIIGEINFAKDILSKDDRRLLFTLWFFSLFFESIHPTKPILAFVGEKDSGKSSTLERIGKLLLGSKYQVTTIASDQKDFEAALTNSAFLFNDNADEPVKWLNDSLATAATGASIRRRVLYTTNTEIDIPIHCYLAITSRTPHFRRDDVADRLLVMTVEYINQHVGLEILMKGLLRKRNKILTQVAFQLQKIVKALRKTRKDVPTVSFRMADFATFALRVAPALGITTDVDGLFRKMAQAQSDFALETDSLPDLLMEWVNLKGNAGREVTAADLCGELSILAEGQKVEFPYDRTPRQLAQRLGSLRSNLADILKITIRDGGSRKRFYAFKFKKTKVARKKPKTKGKKIPKVKW